MECKYRKTLGRKNRGIGEEFAWCEHPFYNRPNGETYACVGELCPVLQGTIKVPNKEATYMSNLLREISKDYQDDYMSSKIKRAIEKIDGWLLPPEQDSIDEQVKEMRETDYCDGCPDYNDPECAACY